MATILIDNRWNQISNEIIRTKLPLKEALCVKYICKIAGNIVENLTFVFLVFLL